MELTKSELEIMNVMWDAGHPMTRGEILEKSTDKNWKDNSIHILLNRLLAKGAIVESGFARSGKSYGRLYEAQLTGTEFYAGEVFNCSAGRLEMLFEAMLASEAVDADLLEAFAEKLNARKAQLS